MICKSLFKYVYNDWGYFWFIWCLCGIFVMMYEEVGMLEFWDYYNCLLKGKLVLVLVKCNFEVLIFSYYESDVYKKLKFWMRFDYWWYISYICEIWVDKDLVRIEIYYIYELYCVNVDYWW